MKSNPWRSFVECHISKTHAMRVEFEMRNSSMIDHR